MLDITNLLSMIKFVDPFRRRRFRKHFTKYILGNHPEGLEYKGLIFIATTEIDKGFGDKETLKVRVKESGKLIYSNGHFCKWSQPIRRFYLNPLLRVEFLSVLQKLKPLPIL